MAQRITKSMKKDDLYEECRALEQELQNAVDGWDSANDAARRYQEDLSEAQARISELESAIETIEEQREAGEIPGQCEACPRTKFRLPKIARAIQELERYDEAGGLPHLRKAERFVRAEIVRLKV